MAAVEFVEERGLRGETRRAIALDPRAFGPRYNEGLALLELGDGRGAERAIVRARRRDPLRAEPHLMLAGLLTDESRARAHLEDALALARSPDARRRALELKDDLDAAWGSR